MSALSCVFNSGENPVAKQSAPVTRLIVTCCLFSERETGLKVSFCHVLRRRTAFRDW